VKLPPTFVSLSTTVSVPVPLVTVRLPETSERPADARSMRVSESPFPLATVTDPRTFTSPRTVESVPAAFVPLVTVRLPPTNSIDRAVAVRVLAPSPPLTDRLRASWNGPSSPSPWSWLSRVTWSSPPSIRTVMFRIVPGGGKYGPLLLLMLSVVDDRMKRPPESWWTVRSLLPASPTTVRVREAAA